MTDESLRKSVRAIAATQYIVAFLMLVASIVALLWLPLIGAFSWRHAGVLALVTMALFFFILARSLRKLRPWARIATAGISCIGMLIFPFGTVIWGPFLYVLLKSKHLFAPPAVQPLATETDRLAA